MRRQILIILFFCVSMSSPVSFARESKQQRKQNALAVRNSISAALMWSDLYSFREWNRESKVRASLEKDLKLIQDKLKGGLANKLKQIIATYFAACFANRNDSVKCSTNTKVLTNFLLKTFEISIVSAQSPDRSLGRQIYEARCATCHGQNGDPKTALVKNLNPKVRSLSNKRFLESFSPFRIFNLCVTGIESSPMKSFEQELSDHEIWSTAFYMQTRLQTNSKLPDKRIEFDTNLQYLASHSDSEIISDLQKKSLCTTQLSCEKVLFYLRNERSFDKSLSRLPSPTR